MSHADMNNCCGFNEAAAAFSWNSPKKAINPYLDPAEVAPVSTLSNLITLYAADNEQEQLRREALSDQVWERYFFNESRDPVQREMEQDKLISRAKLAHEQQRFNSDMVILADVNAQPAEVFNTLHQRLADMGRRALTSEVLPMVLISKQPVVAITFATSSLRHNTNPTLIVSALWRV